MKNLFRKNNILYDVLALIILFAVITFVNSFLFTAPHFSIVGDAQRYNGYQAYIFKYSLDNFGQIGLWDKFLGSGMSWIAHPGGAQFSPTAWLVTFLIDDIYLGSRTIIFIHTITAAFALYFFFRILHLHRLTCLFIAIVGICNQYTTTFIANGWFEELFGITLLPMTIGLLWLAIERKRIFYAILAAFIMSLNFYMNSYYVFHYNVIAILWVIGLRGVYELWKLRRIKKEFRKELLFFLKTNCFFWLIFILLSTAKLLPLLEFRSISSRNVVPLTIVEAAGNVMDPSFLFKYLRDYFIPAGQTNNFTQLGNDIGIILLLVCVVYFLFKRSLKYGIFLGLLILSVWGYLANKVPLDIYAFFYYFLPGFNSNMFPYRFFIIINFAFLTCIALGLDVILKQKTKQIFILGICIGLLLVITATYYQRNFNNVISYSQSQNLIENLRNNQVIIQKSNDYREPPIVKSASSSSLLSTVSNLTSLYKPEGRVYVYPATKLTNDLVLLGEIPTLYPSYIPVIPTYLYFAKDNIIPQMKSLNSLALVEDRFKILSVLNTRFQLQTKDESEYGGCPNLSSISTVKQSDEVCEYLESRLVPLASQKEGTVFYDEGVLPKFAILSHPILLIGDNRFNDYSGFIAKKIMFHPKFDIHKMSVLSGGSTFIDDYDIETLKQFKAVLVVDAKVRNSEEVQKRLNEYEKSGGTVVSLHSSWKLYDSLHQRSESLFTNQPAWNYSKEDSEKMSNLFKTLAKQTLQANVSVNKFTSEDVIVKVTSPEDNIVLQYSDSFFPGWKVKVDAKEAQVYMADGLVKGVMIPDKGTHTVKFIYSPDSLKIGVSITLLTLLSILGYGVFLYQNKRKIQVNETKQPKKLKGSTKK